MNWEQIETEWAAMTRRVRADWMTDRVEVKAPLSRRITRTDVTPASITERKPRTVVDASLKMSGE